MGENVRVSAGDATTEQLIAYFLDAAADATLSIEEKGFLLCFVWACRVVAPLNMLAAGAKLREMYPREQWERMGELWQLLRDKGYIKLAFEVD